MNWEYFYLRNGLIVDKDGYLSGNFPKFESVQEAENYLEKNDIRGTVVDDWKNKIK
jgi:hypothetical protein